MPDNEQEETGPKLEWTFPLLTRVQRNDRGVTLGSNIGIFRENFGTIIQGASSLISDSDDDFSSPDTEDEYGSYGEDPQTALDDMEEEIEDVKESSEMTFGQHEIAAEDELPQTATVNIEDGVFVPTRAEVAVGGTVTWRNNDDEVHRISSIEGQEFTSEQIGPGEEFSQTFNQQGVVVYTDTMSSASTMSGSVTVGDADHPDTLPSEDTQDPVPFETDSTSAMRTMSDAASDKEDMDIGFSD